MANEVARTRATGADEPEEVFPTKRGGATVVRQYSAQCGLSSPTRRSCWATR